MVPAPARMGLYYGWIVVGSVFVVMFFGAGTRFSFGAFYDALLEEFGWSRAALAGAASLNLILAGLVRPGVGLLVDRYGSKAVMLGGLGLAALALVLLSFASQLWHFYVLFTVMSLGYGAASPSTTVPLIANWFVRRRTTAQSLASAGSPMGELLVVPIMTAVLILADWRTAYRLLALFLVLLLIPTIAAIVRNRPEEMGVVADGDPAALRGSGPAAAASEFSMTLAQVARTPLFWQLAYGFFVCGFTMTFASTHFMAFAGDMGFEKMTASAALGLVGGTSILGTVGLGYLADRFSPKRFLALAYLLRGLAFLALWQTGGIDMLFVGVFLLGLSWGATVPLTSSCLAAACGRRYLGTIFGTMFAIMPIAAGTGAFLAGLIFDYTGSYGPALLLNGVLGLSAALVVSLMRASAPPALEAHVAPVGSAHARS
ncbi:MAG: MFS transporter [Chloroflexi bacterium]|nr:MFS transporter [Chloroflexota bacterium]